MFYLSLFLKFVGVRWRSSVEYPVPFALGILAQWLSYGFQFVTMWIMIMAFERLGSWLPMEVLFLYAMNLFTYALGASFTFNTSREIGTMARTGSFDDVLIKPADSLVYMISSNFNVGYVSHLSLAVIAMGISLSSLGIWLTPVKFLWLAATLIGGAMIQGSLLLLFSIPSLFLIGTQNFGNILFGLKDFIHYPLSIFGRPIQLLFTFVLPLAFINFYPAQPLLMKSDYLLFPAAIGYMTPLVGIILCAIVFAVWHIAVNRYESTGS